MKDNPKIKDEFELFLYHKIISAKKKNNFTNKFFSEHFKITTPGFAQKIKRGNYKYIFLLELFPILNLDLQEVTSEFRALKE